MIYLPRRAAFVHIPRTGGNSITSAIATACAGKGIDIVLGTPTGIKNYHRAARHMPAKRMKKFIEEWDDIYKFAVHRPHQERIESVIRLIERDKSLGVHLEPTCGESWKKIVTSENYKEIMTHNWKEHTTEWFTLGQNGEDLGVEIFDYNNLNDVWPEICDKCQIPRCELPHLNKA